MIRLNWLVLIQRKNHGLIIFVLCVFGAVKLLFFFVEYITEKLEHEHFEPAGRDGSSTTTAVATANAAHGGFNGSSSLIEENSTEWIATLPCRRPGLRILYFIHTAPKNAKNRTWLRKTIGDPQIEASVNSAIVFFVGKASDPNEHRLVEEEAAREGDVVVLNFTDTYRNLSLKFFQGAKWVEENCFLNSNTTIVKMDDDILVNVFALSSYVDSLAMQRNAIHCYLHKNVRPLRQQNLKWYVSKEEYAPEKYPTYCAGAAFMMRPAVMFALYEASNHVPLFWIDDVYVTGILASLAKVDMVDIEKYIILRIAQETRTVANMMLFMHTGLPNRIEDKLGELWQSVLNGEKSPNTRRRWTVKVGHRKTLPWLVDWVVGRGGNSNFNLSRME